MLVGYKFVICKILGFTNTKLDDFGETAPSTNWQMTHIGRILIFFKNVKSKGSY